MSVKKNQRGFSIVHVLVAVALLGGLAAATMSLVQNAQKGVHSSSVKAEVDQLVTFISHSLEDLATCEANFSGRDINDSQVDLRDNLLKSAAQGGGRLVSGNLRQYFDISNMTMNIASPGVGVLNLTLTAKARNTPGGGVFRRQIPVALIHNATTVQGCVGSTAICNSAQNAGTTRFNAVTSQMEYCDGAAWQPFSSSLSRCRLRAESRKVSYGGAAAGTAFEINFDGVTIGDGTLAAGEVSLSGASGTQCTPWLINDTNWDSDNRLAEFRSCIVCP